MMFSGGGIGRWGPVEVRVLLVDGRRGDGPTGKRRGDDRCRNGSRSGKSVSCRSAPEGSGCRVVVVLLVVLVPVLLRVLVWRRRLWLLWLFLLVMLVVVRLLGGAFVGRMIGGAAARGSRMAGDERPLLCLGSRGGIGSGWPIESLLGGGGLVEFGESRPCGGEGPGVLHFGWILGGRVRRPAAFSVGFSGFGQRWVFCRSTSSKRNDTQTRITERATDRHTDVNTAPPPAASSGRERSLQGGGDGGLGGGLARAPWCLPARFFFRLPSRNLTFPSVLSFSLVHAA